MKIRIISVPNARNAAHWHADGGPEFLPNENIQNKGIWLNYGTRFQKQRPGTVNIQNLQNVLDSFGSDIQYVWDSPEHKTYSAYRMNPNYRPPLISAERIVVPTTGITASSLALPKITVNIPKPKPLPKKASVPTGTYIPLFGENNGAQGYVVSYLENSPDNKDYYQMEYQSSPGSLNSGEGSIVQTDSVIPNISIEDINTRIFDYKNKAGGNFVKTELSTGGPLYPFSFQKNPYWKTPIVRYDSGGNLAHVYDWAGFLSGLKSKVKSIVSKNSDEPVTVGQNTNTVKEAENKLLQLMPDTIGLPEAIENYNNDLFDINRYAYDAGVSGLGDMTRSGWNVFKNTILNSPIYKVNKNEGSFTLIDPKEYEKYRPKLDYIGGTETEVREKTLEMLNGYDAVESIAKLYGIDPNLLLNRFAHEGLVDSWAKDYNEFSTRDRQKQLREDANKSFWDVQYNGYKTAGLDTVLQNYIDGKLKIKDKGVEDFYKALIANKDYNFDSNEAGDTAIEFLANPKQLLHLQAAYFKKLQNDYADKVKNKEYGDVDLNTFLNALYNLGVNHPDLKYPEWVNKKYKVRDWYGNRKK